LAEVANAVFTTKPEPAYDDLPEIKYHFPQRYLSQAQQTVGDWVIYYEPRRQGGVSSQATGRQCYFAMAQVARIEPDSTRPDHHYAYISNYLEFTNPVPFRSGNLYYESGLKKTDGSTNRGKFGWNLRIIPQVEFRLICQMGFAGAEEQAGSETLQQVAEEPAEFGLPRRLQVLQRPFRDAVFTRLIQTTYDNSCAMTGLKLVNGGGRCEIEAAHIKPVAKEGPDSPRNGIALSRTIHWLFDRGALSVEEDGRILIAKRYVPDPILRMLNPDGRILAPAKAALMPHPYFLRFHREVIYKGN
jgi:putative restriction endonuclease